MYVPLIRSFSKITVISHKYYVQKIKSKKKSISLTELFRAINSYVFQMNEKRYILVAASFSLFFKLCLTVLVLAY